METNEFFTATHLIPIGEKYLIDEDDPNSFQQELQLKHVSVNVKHFESWKRFVKSIGNMVPSQQEFDTWLCGLRH